MAPWIPPIHLDPSLKIENGGFTRNPPPEGRAGPAGTMGSWGGTGTDCTSGSNRSPLQPHSQPFKILRVLKLRRLHVPNPAATLNRECHAPGTNHPLQLLAEMGKAGVGCCSSVGATPPQAGPASPPAHWPPPPQCVPFGNRIWHLQMPCAGNAAVTKRDMVSAFWRTAHKWEEKSTR